MPSDPRPAFEAAFDDSRRLTGPNLFFAGCGAVLEVGAGYAVTPEREAGWRACVADAFGQLGWPPGAVAVRRHAAGAQLAIAAPVDQLLTATSVNEWAWHTALGPPWAAEPDGPLLDDRAAAMVVLSRASAEERNRRWVDLQAAAQAHAVPLLFDDDRLSLGSGASVVGWPLDGLPDTNDVDWTAIRAVPAALVTGSNGKTTTARLLSAIAREAGFCAGHCCTDGLFVDGAAVQAGDYAGPAGARAILRDRRVEVAVLETARGGILRRGLAMTRADVAIVTNVAVDHFGEYGIDGLEALADVKLVVAHAIGADGLLVLNADDAVLAARAEALACPIGWFALDDEHPRLVAHREGGGASCGVARGRMRLAHPRRGVVVDLGSVVDMPLTQAGHAWHNVANLLGAALVASALGLPADAIAATFARFGSDRGDNPGRLARWQLADVRVILDYAHNPDGLRALLSAATAEPFGRLGLVLGQAGNRADAEIRALAATAAAFRPDGIVLKDIAAMQRGRAPGEVAAVLRAELLRCGVPADALAFASAEADAARAALRWARAGDLLVLPIHGSAARGEVEALLGRLARRGWRAGDPDGAVEVTTAAVTTPHSAPAGDSPP